MNRADYPPDWPARARAVKDAAGWRCESCGLQCRRPGEPFDTHRRTLTTAHLDHNPGDPAARLAAYCAPCHLRYDAKMHGRHAAETRRAKRSIGQGVLL